MAVDPIHLAIVRFRDLFRGAMKAFAERALEIGIFDQGNRRIGIAINTIARGEYGRTFFALSLAMRDWSSFAVT